MMYHLRIVFVSPIGKGNAIIFARNKTSIIKPLRSQEQKSIMRSRTKMVNLIRFRGYDKFLTGDRR